VPALTTPNEINKLVAVKEQAFTTLALLLWRRRAILIFFLAGLEKFLKLTSKLWIETL
jgi:hypothetical protein